MYMLQNYNFALASKFYNIIMRGPSPSIDYSTLTRHLLQQNCISKHLGPPPYSTFYTFRDVILVLFFRM